MDTALMPQLTLAEESEITHTHPPPRRMKAILMPQVMHLKGENDRIREQLRLAQKSAAARQTQMSNLHRQVDLLQGKKPDAKSPEANSSESGLRRSTSGSRRAYQGQ